MKLKYLKVLFGIICLLLPLTIPAQTYNACVLVDVSGSVQHSAAVEAKGIVADLLSQGKVDFNQYSSWEVVRKGGRMNTIDQPTGTPFIGPGNTILLRLIGEKRRVNEPAERLTIQQASEITTFINQNYPTTFRDNWTYLKLAQAKAASEIGNEVACSYLQITITDNQPDYVGNFPSGGPNYTIPEQDLVDSYDSYYHVETRRLAIIRRGGSGSRPFEIRISEVQVKTCTPPPGEGSGETVPPRIVLRGVTSSETQPTEYTEAPISIIWECDRCPPEMKYRLQVKKKSGQEFTEVIENRTTTNKRFQMSVNDAVEGATYQITVSGLGGIMKIKGDTGYFKLKAPGFSFLPLLVVLLVIIVGYVLYRLIRSIIAPPAPIQSGSAPADEQAALRRELRGDSPDHDDDF